MEAQDKRMGEYIHPEGVVVEVNVSRIITICSYLFLFLAMAGGLLFNSVWGGVPDYQAGREVGKMLRMFVFSLKGISILFLFMLAYHLMQYALLYWFSGKDRRAICWNKDWKCFGLLLVKPLALRYYRLVLLAPFFILGIFPMVHGFCSGNLFIYVFGILSTGIGFGDCYYCWKLRSFRAEDKIVDGKKPYSCMILKSTY